MNEVVEKSIQRALTVLRACKCDFIVLDEEGTQYSEGNMKLAEPEKEPKTDRKPKGFYADIYRPLMEGMNIGDVASVDTPDGVDPIGLRACMSSYANKMWGANSSTTVVAGGKVELLRVQ